MRYTGYTLHKISSKCGIFAEADANTLLKAGVTVEEIIASLFEAVVYQNLATLTRGNTPSPEVLLLGGPNLFFKGLQEAWRLHLTHIWKERKVQMPDGKAPEDVHHRAEGRAVLRGAGLRRSGLRRAAHRRHLPGHEEAAMVDRRRPARREKEAGPRRACATDEESLKTFIDAVFRKWTRPPSGRISNGKGNGTGTIRHRVERKKRNWTASWWAAISARPRRKPYALSPDKELLFSCYALSKGNPIEDAKSLFRQLREAIGDGEILGLGITGYGKDLLKGILGADCGVVETIAHASAGLHYFPDADCICDVGGVDVKIMILNNGTVSDFRLNSQCSSGNGAFLQGVAERFGIPLSEMADGAFHAQAMPQLSMGCGVFLQSDIVNQQRKGWQAEEILAALCSILPLERVDLCGRA